MKFTLVFSIITLWALDVILAVCPTYQVPHTVDAMTVCCRPVFNCPKGHEIVFCSEDDGKDKCVPCPTGEINSHITSSLDTKPHICFFVTRSHEDCPIEDTYPTADNESCENMYCGCKTEECRYGNVCHICEQRTTECGVNEEINGVTGECEPCKDMMNSPAGCGPCLYNETAWRLSQERRQTNGTSGSQQVFTKATKPEVTSLGVSSLGKDTMDTEETRSNSSVEQKNAEDDDDGFSATPVIIAIPVCVCVSIIVALLLCFIKKLKNGDESSRLVIFYNRLVPNNKYRERAIQRDAELSGQNGNVVRNQNMESRQTQAVLPMARQNEPTIEETSEGADYSENAACNMALLKSDGACSNGREETMNHGTCSNGREETMEKQIADDHQS